MSSNYPYDYNRNESCQVTIEFPEGERVHLEFEDFYVENGDSSEYLKCKNDWLELRDGEDAASRRIETKICGHRSPSRFISKGKSLTLIFKSDGNFITGRGFKIKVDLGELEE